MFCIIQFGNQVALLENIKLNCAVVSVALSHSRAQICLPFGCVISGWFFPTVVVVVVVRVRCEFYEFFAAIRYCFFLLSVSHSCLYLLAIRFWRKGKCHQKR